MQVDINIEKSHEFKLDRALLIYRSNRVAFVTQHAIQSKKGDRPVLSPATPLKVSFLRSLVRDLQGALPPEILPENILARTEQMLCWWTPARQRQMFFGGTQKDMSKVNGHLFPQPPLVWVAKDHQLFLRALPEDVRPDACTRMYFAPFWNISESGDLCTGSMRTPRVATIQAIPRWEDSFYESEFTHGNVGRVTTHTGGFEGLWKSLSGGGKFPPEALIALEETLGVFLKKTAGAR